MPESNPIEIDHSPKAVEQTKPRRTGALGIIAGIVASILTTPMGIMLYISNNNISGADGGVVFVSCIFYAPVAAVGGFLGGRLGGAIGSRLNLAYTHLGAILGGAILGGLPILVFYLVI